MKVGLAGFSGSGKSTVFQWLTGVRPDPSKIQSGQSGHAPVPEPRLDWLPARLLVATGRAARFGFAFVIIRPLGKGLPPYTERLYLEARLTL